MDNVLNDTVKRDLELKQGDKYIISILNDNLISRCRSITSTSVDIDKNEIITNKKRSISQCKSTDIESDDDDTPPNKKQKTMNIANTNCNTGKNQLCSSNRIIKHIEFDNKMYDVFEKKNNVEFEWEFDFLQSNIGNFVEMSN